MISYKATIRRIFREVDTTNPKVLLMDLISANPDFDRDHCYVRMSEIEDIIPREGWYAQVEFTADVIPYSKKGTQAGETLDNIKVIKCNYVKQKVKKPRVYKKKSTKNVMDLFKQLDKEKECSTK